MQISEDRIAQYSRALTDTIGTVRAAHPRIQGLLADRAQEFPAGSVEESVDTYLQISTGLTEEIMAAVNEDTVRGHLAGARADEALGRMAALLGGDLRVAAELAALAGRDPATPDVAAAVANLAIAGPVGLLTSLDDVYLDPSVSEILIGVAGLGVAGAAESAPDQTKLDSECTFILDAGGKELTNLGTAIALTSAQLDAVARTMLGASAAGLFDKVRDEVGGFMKRVVRKLLDVFEAIVTKISQLLGMDAAQLVDKLKDTLQHLLNSVPGQSVAGKILGLALRADEVLRECHRSLDTVDQDTQLARITNCGVISDAFGKRMKYVGWGAAAIGVAHKFSILTAGTGLVVIEVVGAVLMAYVLWATHDYLDSPVLSFLPDRVAGLRHVATNT